MAGLLSRLLGLRKSARPYCAAIVPAAGSAQRMGGTDKLFSELDGVPVLARTLRALEDCPLIDEIIVVTREEQIVPVSALCADYHLEKVRKIVKGGQDREESVALGLREISPQTELAAVHDGARPFVTQEVLAEVIQTAAKTGAAAPAVPVKDTIKVSRDGKVERTLDRSSLRAIQTPQVVQASFLAGALQHCREKGIALTDDCSAVEAMGMSVTLTRGSETNIKITTPIDLAIGEAIIHATHDAADWAGV